MLLKTKNKEKERSIDGYEKCILVVSGFIFVIGAISKTGLYEINYIDLIIIAFSVGLLLIPYASKVKIFGIEFERRKETEKKKTINSLLGKIHNFSRNFLLYL